MKFITEEEALHKVAAYCSAAEHCKAEVSDKLLKWGIAYDAVDRIIDRLVAERYIDDERYCRSYINDKFRFAKWGKVKIAQGLYMKKIPSDVAWRHLNEIDQDAYLDILRGLIAGKRKSVQADNDYELNAKLMRFALSRGFEVKDIKLCICFSDEEEYVD